MFDKKIKKEYMLKNGIDTIENANQFMDRIVFKLSNKDLKRAYESAIKKHTKKQNQNTEYMVIYFRKKLEDRGIKC
jgi:hypothetical protein